VAETEWYVLLHTTRRSITAETEWYVLLHTTRRSITAETEWYVLHTARRSITAEKEWYLLHTASGGKRTQLSYLSKSKDALIENYSSKSESHPVKYYLSESLKVYGFKYV
jgi:hypothetical protein